MITEDHSHNINQGYLHVAVECAFESVRQVKDIMSTLDKLHEVIPLMKRIWEISVGLGPARDVALEDDMGLREQLQGMLRDGVITMESKVTKSGPREVGVVMN